MCLQIGVFESISVEKCKEYIGELAKLRKEISRQIFHYLSEFYAPLLSQIDPYKMGQKNRVAKIASAYALKIIPNAQRLIYYLANDCPDHGFVVDYEQTPNETHQWKKRTSYQKRLKAMLILISESK